MTQILLVEDDEILADLISEYLNENGFKVTHCTDALNASNLIYEQKFDVLILDVKIPKGDGFSLLAQIRKNGNETPAIFTTSLNTLDDLEVGYKSGCDDYLKKPFELKELLIRIQTLLKRKFSHKNDNFINLNNGFKFFIESKKVQKDGIDINLSKKEIALLNLFLQNKNKLLSKEEIFCEIWSWDEEPSEQSLRVYIKNLRQILGKENIINKRDNGYIYV